MLSLLSLTFLLASLAVPFPQAAAPPPAPVVNPAEAPKEDPAVTALALKIYGQMRAGKVDPDLMTAGMNAALTPAALAGNKPVFDQLGDPVKLTLQSRQTTPQGNSYDYLATFAAAQLHVRIFVDTDGKVAGYFLAP